MKTLVALLIGYAFVLLGRAEMARPADSFVESIGVNTHLGYTDTIYREYDTVIKPRLLELGVRHIRDGTWSSNVLAKYLDLHQQGIRVLLISNPKRAVAQAKALGPALWAIEGVNEPDHGEGWESRIRAEQEALYRAVKGDAATAHLPVLVSSLANIRNSPGKLGDLSAFLDFGNIHPYAAGQMPTKHWGWGLSGDQAIAEARKVSASKPIVVTECGYHNKVDEKGHPGVTERAEGKYMPRLLLHYFSRGMVRNYTYEFADEKPDPDFTDKEKHFGLIRRDGSPKPAFVAARNLIALLKDPGPAFEPKRLELTLSGETNNVQRLLLQKRDGRFCLALWQEVPSYDPKTKLDLPVQPRRVRVRAGGIRNATLYVPGQSVAAKVLPSGDEFALDVPDEVVLLELGR